MENDNIYPHSSEFFFGNEPKEQKKARERSENDVLNAVPLLKEVAEHLDKQIAFYTSTASIPADFATEPAKFSQLYLAYSEMAHLLTNERTFISARIKSAK